MAVKTDTQATTLPAQERKPQETTNSSSRGDIPLRWLTSILLLIFPTATLFVDRGDSYVLGLLTLIGIWVWLRDGARRWLDRPAALLWIAFALFFAIALLSYLLGTQTDAGFRFLGRYLRFLLIVPVYLTLRRYPPTAKTVFIGLALGALLAGIIGGLHVYHADAVIRIEAMTGQPIIFGDLATTMALCTVAGFSLLTMSRRTWTVPLLIFCVAGGVAATLLSASRGAWIPLLFLPLFLMTPVGSSLKRGYLVAIVAVLVAVFSSFYLIGRSGTHERISDAYQGLRGYAVALATADDNRGSAHLHCDGSVAFLDAWLNAAYVPENLRVRTVLSRGDRMQSVSGCGEGYALSLQNTAYDGQSTAVFHRLPSGGTGPQMSALLVRGTGTVGFEGAMESSVSFSSEGFRRVVFSSRTAAGNAVNVNVAAHDSVVLIPLDGYFGEYSMSIANDSVGNRFEMWRGAWLIFLRHPVLGAGFGAFQKKIEGLIEQNRIAGFAGNFDHPHNDYMNALSSSGIVGFVLLLGILGLPVWHFSRKVRTGNPVVMAVSMAGLLTVLGFAIYALTDTIFLHSMMITWFVVYMALFYALLSAQASRPADAEAPKQ